MQDGAEIGVSHSLLIPAGFSISCLALLLFLFLVLVPSIASDTSLGNASGAVAAMVPREKALAEVALSNAACQLNFSRESMELNPNSPSYVQASSLIIASESLLLKAQDHYRTGNWSQANTAALDSEELSFKAYEMISGSDSIDKGVSVVLLFLTGLSILSFTLVVVSTLIILKTAASLKRKRKAGDAGTAGGPQPPQCAGTANEYSTSSVSYMAKPPPERQY